MIGNIIAYGIVGLVVFGWIMEQFEKRPQPTRNIGRRAAHYAKAYRASVAASSGIVAPIVAKSRSRRQPVAADPARADVISALRNLVLPPRVANATYNKVTGTGFDEKLKNCLALMASQPSLWSKP